MVAEPIIYLAAPPEGMSICGMLLLLSSFSATSSPKGSMDADPVILQI
jgi:hypothetical protein